MYSDVTIPLPKETTLEDINNLPLPFQKLALRSSNPPYQIDRERLQWIYRSYYAAVSQVDREVGLILETLEETGHADDTIVLFTSDHGAQLLEHGIMDKNCLFEASIRVPLIVHFPNRVIPGQYTELIESIDILPTIYDLIGLPQPYNCQGKSFASLII
jgi:arylsulfatase A-like enzyme